MQLTPSKTLPCCQDPSVTPNPISSKPLQPLPIIITQQNHDGGNAPNELLFNAGSEFGGLVSRIEMSEAVEMACGERGIAAGVSFGGVTLTLQELGQDPRADDIRNALRQAGGIFPLQPFQILAVSRFVYMPRRHIEVRRIDVQNEEEFETVKIFKSPESDIGSFALLDTPTGTGKTITSLLGAVLFCAVRGGDMAKILLRQKECYTGSSTTSVVTQDALDAWPQAGAGRRCIVFVAGHLVNQWVDHVDTVRKITKSIPALEKWEVSVRIGDGGKKGDHTHVLEENEVRVYVCSLKTPKTRPVSYLRKTTYYSTIVFDECGENSTDVNGMLSVMPKGVRYGKIFSCSADLTPWERLFPQKPSVFRQVFPEWHLGCRHAMATACASAIFTPDQRSWVMNECAQTLRGIFIATASVEYVPSLAERVGVGYGVELGNKSGHDLFQSKYGVDVSGIKTHHDMKVAIQARITVLIEHMGVQGVTVWRKQELEKKRDVLVKLLPRVACLPDETCCICLGTMESASLLQPCMHSICSSPCAEDLLRMNMSCPTCRGRIGSKMNVDVVHTPVPVVDVEPRHIKKQRLDPVEPVDQYPRVATTAAEAALEEIRISCGQSPPTGVKEAVRRTLLSIKEARKRTGRGSDTLLVMVIIPDVDVKEGLFDDLGFNDIMYHRIKGSRGDRVYQAKIRAKLKVFEEKNGRSKILFVRDGHTDCMTGLDIEGLDAVISVGRGNFAQRLGRLCRFSRARLSVEKRNALYVEIVPRMWL